MVEALSCGSFSSLEREICEDILESDATEIDKTHLVANIHNFHPNVANHSFVDIWNRGIHFISPPNDIEARENGIIQGAWLKIVAISPSVILGENLLTSGIGNVQSAFHYQIELPSNNEGNDCKTEYSLVQDNSQLSVFLNGQKIGSSTYVSFSGAGNLDFEAQLDISAKMKVVHYEDVRYCCRRRSGGGCSRYCTRCEQEDTEQRNFNIHLEDSKRAESQWNAITPTIKTLDSYQNTISGVLNISGQTSFNFRAGESYFEYLNYHYEYNSSLQPYGVLSIKAIQSRHKSSKDMILEEFNSTYLFHIPYSDNCQFQFSDHFHTWSQECDLEVSTQEPSIKTDKLRYNENETIHVDIEPKGIPVLLKYGKQEILAINNAQFIAQPKHTAITASIEGRNSESYVHVEHLDVANFTLNAGVFSAIVYGYFVLVRKYWRI